MTLLLGLLFFLALAVIAFINAVFGDDASLFDDASLSWCPSCGLESLSYRGDNCYACRRCGARFERLFDGRMVPA